MSVKRAALILLVAWTILIAIIAIGLQTLPPEYFGNGGLLATRYDRVFEWFIFILYSIPLFILMLSLINAGAGITLKKATLILIVSVVILVIGPPMVRSMLPPEYLAETGFKAATYKLFSIEFGLLFVMVPFAIFLIILLQTGADKKTKDHSGFLNLRIKVGLRWLAAIYGGVGGVMVAYVVIYARVDFSGASVALLAFLLACAAILIGTIWSAIFAAVLRVRYDDTRIIATTPFFRQREHSWGDLLKIKDMHFSGGKRLIFRNTRTAHIVEYLEGYDDLMEHANKVLNDA